jgi:hypothetical protein
MLARIAFALTLIAVLSACGEIATRPSATASKTMTEVGPGRADRVAALGRLLDGRAPSMIIDGRLLQVQHGDGVLGPSDFRIFALINVGPENVVAWRSVGAAGDVAALCDGHADQPTWWLTGSDCAGATRRDVAWFTANDGAMFVLSDGRVFIFTATR